MKHPNPFQFFDEVAERIEEAFLEMGVPPTETSNFVSRIADMPIPSMTPHFFRGKNGLLLNDNGNWSPFQVCQQLENVFPHRQHELTEILEMDKKHATWRLQEIIEEEGFDHIVYINTVEDKGRPSIINWKPENFASIWDSQFTAGNPDKAAAVATSYIMSLLGIGVGTGAAVQQTESE